MTRERVSPGANTEEGEAEARPASVSSERVRFGSPSIVSCVSRLFVELQSSSRKQSLKSMFTARMSQRNQESLSRFAETRAALKLWDGHSFSVDAMRSARDHH